MKKIISFLAAVAIFAQMLCISVSAEDVQQKQNGLANSLWQLKNGSTFTVGYLGGSITAGFGSQQTGGYANISFNAIKNQYARTGLKFTKYQSAVGGTGTDYGSFRADEDLYLINPAKVPDLTFVEFGVNDKYHQLTSAQSKKYMETIVRKLYKSNPEMDIVILFTTDNADRGKETSSILAHKEVAEKYGIPYLNVGADLVAKIRSEVSEDVTFNDLWAKYVYDSVHPLDAGYEVYSASIMKMLNEEWAKSVPESQTSMVLSEAAFGGAEELYMAGIKDYTPGENQIPAVSQSGSNIAEYWKNGSKHLKITGANQDYSFKFTGTGLMSRISPELDTDAGRINFYIDGEAYYVSSYPVSGIFEIASGLEYGEHTVTVYSTNETNKTGKAIVLQGFGILGDPERNGITTVDIDAQSIVGKPRVLIPGNEVGITFEYHGKTSIDNGTYEYDPDKTGYLTDTKANKYEYDSETGVTSIELINPTYTGDGASDAYFLVYPKHEQLVKKAPYMAIGMYYTNPADADGTELSDTRISLDDGNVLWSKGFDYPETLSKQIIDITSYTEGKTGGYSKVTNKTKMNAIQINPIVDSGYRVPAGTKIGIQYVAFFDTPEAAQNYVYQKPSDEVPYYDEGNKIRVLQHNLQSDATLTAEQRSSGFVAEIEAAQPDIMGYQESGTEWSQIQLNWANENGYDHVYNYRPYNASTNETTPILWKKDKYSLLDTGIFWLRDNPTEKGYNTWGDADEVRPCTWVKLRVTNTGSYFYVLNTQFGVNYAEETKSAQFIIDMLKAEEPLYTGIDICNDAPAILMGDLNTIPNSRAFVELGSYLKNTDVNRECVPTLSDTANALNNKFDHCYITGDTLASLGCEVDLEKRVSYDGNSYFVSDHNAIISDVAILGEPVSAVLPQISVTADKTEVAEGETVEVEATVTTPNAVKDVTFYIDDIQYSGEVEKNGQVYTAQISGLEFGYHYIKAVVTDEYNNKARETVKVFSRKPYVAIVPEVLINAGAYKDATPSYNYKIGAALMRGGNYNNPNLNVQYGIFMKLNLPELPENYEVKKARMLGSLYYDSHLNTNKTGQKGSTFIYNLTGDIESDYKYYTDTQTYTEKNLALLVPGGENAWALKGAVSYANSNYTENVVDSYNYNLNLNVLKYINSLYGDSKKAVTQSLMAISNQDLAFRGKNMTNPVVFYLEIGEKLDAEFTSNCYAYENEGFGVAIKVNTDNVKSVVFDVNGVEYEGTVNENGDWSAYVENGLAKGDYTITAKVTDGYNATTEKTQSFTVHNSYKFMTGSYVVKYQSSNNKWWKFSNHAENYDLRYNGGTKDALYSAINLSSLKNTDAIDKIYFVTSTATGTGDNQYTKFVFNECGEVSSTLYPSGSELTTFPTTGEEITSGVYTDVSVEPGDVDYATISANVPTKNNDPNYIKFDVTDYIKNRINNGTEKLYFRTSVVNSSGGNYALSVNNTTVRLYVKYKDSAVIDNYDGTTSYVINPADYNVESLSVIEAIKDESGKLLSTQITENVTGRKLFRYDNDEKAILYIWDSVSGMKPLSKPVITGTDN